MDRLLEEDRDEGEESYLDVLTDLVEAYEARRATIPDASEADVLRLLMTANGFSQSTLSAEAGISQSTLSAILNGKRSLTRGQMITLANRFHVSPAVFLPVVKS
jgi:HTH-type transcriptional regulator/antitoxin HigA